MTDGSLCAMGGLTLMPVRSAVRHFGADFGADLGGKDLGP
jgi:formate dehydrogenase iron-sulfur subunit